MRSVIYFGCRGSAGHDVHGPLSGRRWVFLREGQPWGLALDGRLAPRSSASRYAGELPQGKALLHQQDGWTAIAFWDRTGDRRPNSNSAFLVHEIVTFDELLGRARREWPELFARFDFEIEQVDAPCRLDLQAVAA